MSLLKAYQNIARVAKEKRKLKQIALREKFRKFREYVNNNRENGRDPLLIFPEEIWIMILDYLTVANDRSSISRTCRLFERLVGKDKVELLFGKVLPLLFTQLGSDEREEYSTRCRDVCKNWRSGVVTCLENYHLPETTPRDIVDILKIGGVTPKVPPSCYEFLEINPSYSEQTDPSVYNFRKVELEAEEYSQKLCEGWRSLLERNGQHILYLTLDGFWLDTSFSDLTEALVQSLRHCANLRTLEIEGWSCENWLPEQTFSLPPDIQILGHPHLQSIKITCNTRRSWVIQDKLIGKYCEQLKHLSVCFWNAELYKDFPWSNLEELEVSVERCVPLLAALELISAPKLRKLGFRLDKSGPKLKNIFSVIIHFPNLTHLCFRISHKFPGFMTEDIASLSPDVVCSASISTLELTARTKEFCYDFVICFPYLRRLILQRGSGVSNEYYLNDYTLYEERDANESDCESDDDSLCSTELVEGNVIPSSGNENVTPQSKSWNGTTNRVPRDTSDDFIQLSGYIPIRSFMDTQDKLLKQIHKSNIWTLFPYLKEFKIIHVSSIKYDHDWRIYGRELYEWRSRKKHEGIKTQLRLNETRRTIQKTLRKKEQKEYISCLNTSIVPPPDAKHPLQLLSKQMWTMILGYISDSEDIFNCSRSCRLFVSIFNETKPDWLFGKIFPIIYNRLQKQDVLSCRLVCTKWSKGIDHYLEKYFCENHPSGENKHLFEYKFHAGTPPSEGFPKGHDTAQEKMKLHTRNPFVGRSVTVCLIGPNFSIGLNQFYDNFGQHIWHVQLCSQDKAEFIVSPVQYKNLFLDTFQKCPNLRTFRISKVYCPWNAEELTIHCNLLRWDLNVQAPFLESLTIDDSNPKAKYFLKKLMECYGNQLKCLYVHCRCEGEKFPELQTLSNLAPFTNFWSNPLRLLKANSLTNLEIKLGGDFPKLKILMEELYHHEKLKELKIQFLNDFRGFSDNEIVNMMTFDSKLIAPPSLTKLEIITPCKNISYDFLVFFPYLKEFIVRYGRWMGYNPEREQNDGESDDNEDYGLSDSSSDSESEQDWGLEQGDESQQGQDDQLENDTVTNLDVSSSSCVFTTKDISSKKEREETRKEERENGGDGREPIQVSKPHTEEIQFNNSGDNNEESNRDEESLKLNLESDYIQLAKFMQDDSADGRKNVKIYKEIYNSKIWQVMPYLEQLKVIHVIGNEEKEESKTLLYTRRRLETLLATEAENYK